MAESVKVRDVRSMLGKITNSYKKSTGIKDKEDEDEVEEVAPAKPIKKRDVPKGFKDAAASIKSW